MTRERRRFVRIPQPFEAKYHRLGELSEVWRQMMTVNLGAGGIRFRSTEVLQAGDRLEVQIQLPGGREPLYMEGRVIWSLMQASGVTEHGVEFSDLTPEQQAQIDEVVAFLKKHV